MATTESMLFCRKGYHFIERGSVRHPNGRRKGSLQVDEHGINRGEYEHGVDRGESYLDADPDSKVKCDEHNDYAVWRKPLPDTTTLACDNCDEFLLIKPVERRHDGIDYTFCTTRCAEGYNFNG